MIAIIDCNNFYVSCERLFRPDLMGKPVVVLSNNDGCIISRSQEAKALGIEMGAPYFKVKQELKLHNVTVFSSNYTLYGDLSQRVVECIDQYSDLVEVYSVDEAFAQLHTNPVIAYKEAVIMRKQILQWTGIPVKIGIATSKTLAKICAKKAKKTPSGVYLVHTNEQITNLLTETKINSVWGIGKGLGRQLNEFNISTALEYTQLPVQIIQKRWGVIGMRMLKELQGMSCYPVETKRKIRKRILNSRSFSKPISSLETLKEAIATHTQECVDKLRLDGLMSLRIGVYVKLYGTNNYREYESRRKEIALTTETDDITTLTKAAITLIQLIYEKNRSYKKVGVYMVELRSKNAVQHHLFDKEDRERTQKLANSIDLIRKRFGKNTIKLASCGTSSDWKMKSNYCSPRSTTHKNELRTL